MSGRARTGRSGGRKKPAPSSASLPATPKPAPGLMLTTYRALATVAGVAAPLLLAARMRRGKELAERRGERLGRPSAARPEGTLIWFHAASVGETNAVLPLLTAVNQERPDVSLLLTTGTVTSAQLAESRLNACARHQFIPLDSPAFVRSFLDHWRPDVAIFAESEIWPSFVLEIGARDIPLILVNGRLSERSYERWRRWPGVSKPLLAAFRLVLAQNERIAQQFESLGAQRSLAVGNLKMDAPPPPVDAGELVRLRAAIGDRPLFLAASTHPGEDAMVAAAHIQVRKRHPGLLTLLVPRHPSRGPAIAADLGGMGLTTAQRSKGELPDQACDIYVADTIGELGLFYALAPVAFIGGSLRSRGGQNPVEAVKLGAAVIIGPHYANFADAYGALLQAQACLKVDSEAALAAAVDRLLSDERAREQMLSRARQVIEGLGGALQRTLEAVLPLLPAPKPPQRLKARRAS